MREVASTVTEMTETQRKQAQERFALIRPYFEEGVSQVELARVHQIPLKTLERWVGRYRADGLRGLGRRTRSDQGVRRGLPKEQVLLIEGLALQPPRRSMATIHRLVSEASHKQGWPVPGYRRVCQMVRGLSPALMTLSHEGRVAHRETYDLLYRWEASRPNEIWQADHYKLPIWLGERERRSCPTLAHGDPGRLQQGTSGLSIDVECANGIAYSPDATTSDAAERGCTLVGAWDSNEVLHGPWERFYE